MPLPLSNIVVADFSSRLPGPLAARQLQELGATVIKIETQTHRDPFSEMLLGENDLSFQNWYQSINTGKEIIIVAPDSPKLDDIRERADIVLMGWPEKVQKKFNVTMADFKKAYGAFITMKGSREHGKAMHDLNVLADAHLLALHLKETKKEQGAFAPPFLPVAGITFAASIANAALASTLQAQRKETWINYSVTLTDSIDLFMKTLFNRDLEKVQHQFLHSGRYPCYTIYPLKDRGHLAVACLEEKFWKIFVHEFGLPVSDGHQFSESSDVFEKISQVISTYELTQMQAKVAPLDCCISLVPPLK